MRASVMAERMDVRISISPVRRCAPRRLLRFHWPARPGGSRGECLQSVFATDGVNLVGMADASGLPCAVRRRLAVMETARGLALGTEADLAVAITRPGSSLPDLAVLPAGRRGSAS